MGEPFELMGKLEIEPGDLAVLPGGRIVVIGFTELISNLVACSEDGGKTWIKFQLDAVEHIAALANPVQGEILFLLGEGQLYRSRDGGRIWSRMNSITRNIDLFYGLNESTLFGIGSNLDIDNIDDVFLWSFDGGLKWEETPILEEIYINKFFHVRRTNGNCTGSG